MKIGVMGACGSFSEQAGEEYLRVEKVIDNEIIPLVSAENVLVSLENGAVDKGIFPIENSNAGMYFHRRPRMSVNSNFITVLLSTLSLQLRSSK